MQLTNYNIDHDNASPTKCFSLCTIIMLSHTHNNVCAHQQVQLDEDHDELMHRAIFDHPYPTTKVMWIPDPATHYPDLLATSGDYRRLWKVDGGELLSSNELTDTIIIFHGLLYSGWFYLQFLHSINKG